MCSLLCFGRKNSRGADLRDKTYTLCAPLKPCDLAPTLCGLFSCRASLSLAPPAPPDQPGSCWTFGHLREGWKRYPLTSLQCKRPSSPRPSVATPLQRRPYFPTESGLRFPLYPACSVPGVIHILLQVRLVVPHPSPVSDSELPESMLCLPQ